MLKMKKNILKDWFCELCSLQFDKKYVYDVHMSLVHKKTVCPQSKIDKTAVKKKNGDLGQENSFDLIQNSIIRSNINKKNDAVHERKKPHQCSICDYSCAYKQNLKKHIDAVHEGKKPHKCSICDYKCTTKSNLKVHIDAIHEGRKPHKCSFCDRSFALNHQMKKHINKIHA